MNSSELPSHYPDILRIPTTEARHLTADHIRTFQDAVLSFYKHHGRSFPWRATTEPYEILVSEMMLQQTQVSRVIRKYTEFVRAVPDFDALSNAGLSEVLLLWQGLGYNRRAKALKQIGDSVVRDFGGSLPRDPAVLETFPMIGRATARSIVAFAFNKPVVFLETNIRHVFISTFFPFIGEGDAKTKKNTSERKGGLRKKNPQNRNDSEESEPRSSSRSQGLISAETGRTAWYGALSAAHNDTYDKNINSAFAIEPPTDGILIDFAQRCLYRENPRLWYNALMDYGSYLKRIVPINGGVWSAYKKQPSFKNSNRQIRGRILKHLLIVGAAEKEQLQADLPFDAERVSAAVEQLAEEGFIEKNGGVLTIRP